MTTADLLSVLSEAFPDQQPANALEVKYTRFDKGIRHVAAGKPITESLADWAARRRKDAEKLWPGGDKNRCPVEVGAVLHDNARTDAAVEMVTWCFFDVDGGGAWDLLLQRLRDAGAAFLATQSSSHGMTPEGAAPVNKWHLYLPLRRPIVVPADGTREWKRRRWAPEYAHVCGVLRAVGELPDSDQSTDDLAQPCYAARRPPEGARIEGRNGRPALVQVGEAPTREIQVQGGGALDWDTLLARTGYVAPAAQQAVAATAPGAEPPEGATPGETTGTLCRAAADSLGMVGPPIDENRWMVLCPWAHEHTTGQQHEGQHDSSTVIFLSGDEGQDGGFKCQHSHCAARGAAEFLSWARHHGATMPDRQGWGRGGEAPAPAPAPAPRTVGPSAVDAAAKLGAPLLQGAVADGLRNEDEGTWALFDHGGQQVGWWEPDQPLPPGHLLCSAVGRSCLLGTWHGSTFALCKDPADLIVIMALGWGDGAEVAAFAGGPADLKMLSARRADWGARVILVGIDGRELPDVVERTEVCVIESPARALLRRGPQGGEQAAKTAIAGTRVWERAAHGDYQPAPLIKYRGCNDIDNGRRFVDAFGGHVMCVRELGTVWYAWSAEPQGGARWAPDRTGKVDGMAKAVAERIATQEAARLQDEAARETMRRWGSASLKRRARETMLHDASSIDPRSGAGLTVTIDRLDADPYALNCMNGVIDLRTGELRPPKREDYCTKMAPCIYDPTATAPLWLRCLTEWFADPSSGVPDQPLIDYVQALAGYALTGDVCEEKFWIMTGGGKNGKTTFCKVLQRVMGDYAGQAAPSLLMETGVDKASPGHMSAVAVLRGMRLVIAAESQDTDILSDGTVKALCSRDPISAKYMRQDIFTFNPSHKIVLTTNHMPTIRGRDVGIWRRVKPIEWRNEVPADRVDRHLDDKLWQERAGILAWLVRGCLAWLHRGALRDEREPDALRAMSGAYREDQDIIGAFLRECTQVAPDAEESAKLIAATFESWYFAATGDRKPPTRWFQRQLTAAGFLGGQDRQGTTRVRKGLRLRPNTEHYQSAVRQQRAEGGRG